MQKKKYYLVAASGGPDSTYLVHWLWNHGYRRLILAHVNYHWRKDSDYDQKIVESLAKKFNLPLEIKSLSAHQEKPKTANFESWARNERYDFFESLKDKYATETVVVGHQENDLIETFLMQQERQTIVKHYGLPTITMHHNLQIWRPLLTHKKSEILMWLEAQQIPYAIDKTNNNLALQRNRIRRQIKETDFDAVHQTINFFNQENQKQNQFARRYLTKNQTDNSLFLTKELSLWNQEQLQRLIYLFFQNQKVETPLIGRKKQITREVARRITQSNKNFWFINLGSQILIKDYDFLHFLTEEELPKNSTTLHSKIDFVKLEKFINKEQIVTAIKTHNYQFPYEVWSLIPSQIKGQKWGKNSLQTILGKQKFSYKKRFKTGIIYDLQQKKLLNLWQW